MHIIWIYLCLYWFMLVCVHLSGFLCIYMHLFPKRSLAVGVLTVLLKGLAGSSAPGELPALSYLCAGCGNGEGHLALVYAALFIVNTMVLVDFISKTSLEPLAPVGGSWVRPGCFLGDSWVSPVCFQMPPDDSR